MSEAALDDSHVGAAYRPIERRTGLSPADFQAEYCRANRPVVLERFADLTGAQWTPAYWKSAFGARKVEAEDNEELYYLRRKREVRLAELVDSILADSMDLRLRSYDFFKLVPELKTDFDHRCRTESYLGSIAVRGMYFAPRGNVSAFHHDFATNNLNVQMYGSKRFILAPPRCFSLLDPRDFGFSPINPLDPGCQQQHPRFADLADQLVEAVLHPGDALFIPKYWWHIVLAVEPSINVVSISTTGGVSSWQATADVPLAARLMLVSQASLAGRVAAAGFRAYRRVRRPPPLIRQAPPNAAS
ncbi:cupin-like domain-containing protein [Sorangium sp. So ce1151]|uniref:cupin-like domain-containing protein n=1 Tax=Sorangium sp. So ce1151 TaxID=3133332 RepID=UPI003F60A453